METLGIKALAVRKNRAASARLSLKKDLDPTEISFVGELLLRDNALSFVLSHSQSISASWESSIQAVASRDVVGSMVAAFDVVHRLTKVDRRACLLLRFSHVQLQYTIDALKTIASKDVVSGIPRKLGYGNASLTIDTYLEAKKNARGEVLSRGALSQYRWISSRWADFAGRRPIQLCIYSEAAETVMCVSCPLVPLILNFCKPKQFNHIK